ncbi:uncharacterized protein BJ212DRAFT_1035281 [Suillus subaureus]|uniref:Uncharacterized protein n=1 Tax=Suillus subaureus TaxID=48587 RepID=A0A9P7EFT0_9AGAM|nr:uncharacterized protein BJ212DRAFT_1035281 [Suillus subaureus]KAG1820527.1 hypothetical protein BJ212DRAFT_1035281 [Suillus subaureus]
MLFVANTRLRTFQPLNFEEKDSIKKFPLHLARDKLKQAVEKLMPMWTEVDTDDALELLGPGTVNSRAFAATGIWTTFYWHRMVTFSIADVTFPVLFVLLMQLILGISLVGAPIHFLLPSNVQRNGRDRRRPINAIQNFCFTAFTILRKSVNLILNLGALMVDANVPDIKHGDVHEQIQEKSYESWSIERVNLKANLFCL